MYYLGTTYLSTSKNISIISYLTEDFFELCPNKCGLVPFQNIPVCKSEEERQCAENIMWKLYGNLTEQGLCPKSCSQSVFRSYFYKISLCNFHRSKSLF